MRAMSVIAGNVGPRRNLPLAAAPRRWVA